MVYDPMVYVNRDSSIEIMYRFLKYFFWAEFAQTGLIVVLDFLNYVIGFLPHFSLIYFYMFFLPAVIISYFIQIPREPGLLFQIVAPFSLIIIVGLVCAGIASSISGYRKKTNLH